MLENPTDENVVRWGNDGDSFVVLEVGAIQLPNPHVAMTDDGAEREIHKTHTSETFQAQQFRKLRPAAQQVRLPQGPAQQ
jgi:hypothetical protein